MANFVDWTPGGNSLIIKDKSAFSYGLLHKYFPYHNINIFQTNLKKIGFLPAGSEKSERLEYIHPFGKDLKKSNFKDRVSDHVANAARMWRTSVHIKKSQANLQNEPDPVETGQLADMPMQYLKRKLKNVPLFKDFLHQVEIDVEKLPILSDAQKQELLELHKVVMDHIPHFRAYFRYLCLTVGEINGLTSQGYKQFTQWCNITDQNLSQKDLDILFSQTVQATSEKKDSIQLKENKKESTRILSFTGFLALLLKLAMRKYPAKDSLPSQKMDTLLKMNILPQAMPIFADDYTTLHELHHECVNPAVISVLEKHQKDLATVYTKAGGKMNFDAFKLFLMQSKVVGDEIQFAFVKQAFMASSILVNGKDGELEMGMDQFLKALVIFCKLHRNVEALAQPFQSSLDLFLSSALSDYLSSQKSRTSNLSLPSNPPPRSLSPAPPPPLSSSPSRPNARPTSSGSRPSSASSRPNSAKSGPSSGTRPSSSKPNSLASPKRAGSKPL
eukprot:Phypoly_transcript_07900.p1 GENE.Phypoly_transcript_07900~~Phypoly_transcript_07900.p1  ORF type:complete len:519 (+),score=92.66 Phypoly_transcript_07900:57-1559(+)